SIACLCLPGIIHNLEKWNQVQCKYALCLGNEVRERGLPVSFCDEQKSYDECAFFFNQIFNAIPFTEILSDFGALLENLLTNPTALISTVLGTACDLGCEAGRAPGGFGACYLCNLYNEMSKIADAVISLKTFYESTGDFYKVDDGYCGKMKDLKKEIKAEQAGEATPAEEEEADPGMVDLPDQLQPGQDEEEFEEVASAQEEQDERASRSSSSSSRGRT
ncbi:MAG TPA: hypothetical protein VJH22_04955, partial [Candidatus Nanoarchaeia archaeon]|nr:hypothetical protein [Candidatus Nanoarchaeia archaeon]